MDFYKIKDQVCECPRRPQDDRLGVNFTPSYDRVSGADGKTYSQNTRGELPSVDPDVSSTSLVINYVWQRLIY